MARKPVVELARWQMERNLGYWVLRMCKLSSEHPLPDWDFHTHISSLVYCISAGDKVSIGLCPELCWWWCISSLAHAVPSEQQTLACNACASRVLTGQDSHNFKEK